MIVGTAGHIDHGKTALVQALTGTNTDRLPEERQRGISIELGYAFLDCGEPGRIAFVDVPGHERLVHTMLAGATGIDYALLVVAADDGPMPQTAEHLAVLSLLGIDKGAVVITKTDRVDAERLEQVRRLIGTLMAETPLAGVPIIPVSSRTFAGLDLLRAELCKAASTCLPQARDDARGFRLSVDRAFTVKGAGTVVTGSASAGQVRVGDELELVPGGRRVRVRGMHVQNRPAQSATAGQRVALQLAGVALDEVRRGHWLCNPSVALPTRRVDALVQLWRGEDKPLRPGTTVHFHHGASDIMAAVAFLDERKELVPGAAARAQLVLRKPTGAWRGDRFVLRDTAAQRTIGGGRILDPEPPTRYRRTAQRLAELDCHADSPAERRLAALIAVSASGVNLKAWSRTEGRIAAPSVPLPESVCAGDFVVSRARLEDLGAQLLATLARFHSTEPDAAGLDSGRARRIIAPMLSLEFWEVLLKQLAASGAVVRRGSLLQSPQHDLRLSAIDDRIAEKALPYLRAADIDPPWLRDLGHSLGEEEAMLRGALVRLSRRGELHQVIPDLFYSHEVISRLASVARALACQHRSVAAADFRDATGMRRKRAIQVLEYFDRIGLLRRVGDVHYLRSDSTLFL